MNAFTYWPYDEVTLEIMGDEIIVHTPWMKAQTHKEIFNAKDLSQLCAKLSAKSLSIKDLVLVNDFFKRFHQYPLAYILPAPKASVAVDSHTIVDETVWRGSFAEVLSTMLLASDDRGQNFRSVDLKKLMALLPRRSFEWDCQPAIKFASIDDRIHPESLFSVARRYHILEMMSSDKGSEIFEKLSSHSPEDFRQSISRLIRQNHYVTEKCQAALAPAISLAGLAAALVKNFIDAERGHDEILKKSLAYLGVKAKDVAVSVQTKALMALLKGIAQRNFLAFAMAIDAFERNNFATCDPMAQLLKEGGYEKAAHFIDLHMKINDQGNHDNIARQFLYFMAPCERNYALEALRLMELLSMIMSSISASAEISL